MGFWKKSDWTVNIVNFPVVTFHVHQQQQQRQNSPSVGSHSVATTEWMNEWVSQSVNSQVGEQRFVFASPEVIPKHTAMIYSCQIGFWYLTERALGGEEVKEWKEKEFRRGQHNFHFDEWESSVNWQRKGRRRTRKWNWMTWRRRSGTGTRTEHRNRSRI